MKILKKILPSVFISCLLIVLFSASRVALGQETTPTPTPTPNNSQAASDLQNRINELEGKVNELRGQANTLSSQIAVLDSQIRLTELRIESNRKQVTDLTLDIDTADKKIDNLQESLDNLSQALVNRIKSTYIVGAEDPFHVLLSSSDASNFFKRLNYLKIAQAHDRRLIVETTAAKNDYENQKDILEDKKAQIESLKKQLDAYSSELDGQKQSKKTLLAETQGSEANYQRILAETRAQLASFSQFVTSQGGASILSNQTKCDEWGCYYNQRDSQWGNNPLNGTQYTVASDGCLVTSMAMLYTHYGYKDVNPQTINSVSSNFAGIPPALLKYSITANGISSERIGVEIDLTLASGHPVVIGISYDGGSLADHFLVLVSGSGGNYIMNDPFTPNGHNISFGERYPGVRIVQMNKVIFK